MHDGDAYGSVLVEDGMLVETPVHSAYGHGVPQQHVPLDAHAFAAGDASSLDSNGLCRGCPGTGCEQCRPAALSDRCACGRRHAKKACWIGRADALILWRNAPPDRPIVDSPLAVDSVLDASDMDSTAAAGPRFSILRVNNCTGHAIEATYLHASNFKSQRLLGDVDASYDLASPGIFGNEFDFDSAEATLGSRLQSFELNRHHAYGRFVRFLAGFRWIEWHEQFKMEDSTFGGITDYFDTNCFNSLYGGQIGLDANLIGMRWLRLDGVVKAGAYYNNAVQSSTYTTNDPVNPGTAAVSDDESPLSCGFAGEVGLTGVVPLTDRLDFRFGYFGLWLSGLAQPTQQLSGQQLTPGEPSSGSINDRGGVVVQGVSLGLEGRW